MELFGGKVKLSLDGLGILWGRFDYDDGIKAYHDYSYYIYFWNLLSKEYRYWGQQDIYYDGPHRSFGLWFTNISWCFPGDDGEDLFK